ncbi:hypothetical protein SAY86_024664 [Trapa natans]|uniref:Complex III subunit 9 n=1 Tax=Trapa natans TaxID=22666 RepID=A0AAN7M5K4_TRANT|nr:hypothetical protein SAY86_024664 [Trapa natans]
METATRKSAGGLSESFYRLIMRRNSIYVTFIIAGAFFGERAVDYGVKKLWERNNVGVTFLVQFYLLFCYVCLQWYSFSVIECDMPNNPFHIL